MADHAEKRTQYIMAKDALSESVIEEIKGISKMLQEHSMYVILCVLTIASPLKIVSSF